MFDRNYVSGGRAEDWGRGRVVLREDRRVQQHLGGSQGRVNKHIIMSIITITSISASIRMYYNIY